MQEQMGKGGTLGLLQVRFQACSIVACFTVERMLTRRGRRGRSWATRRLRRRRRRWKGALRPPPRAAGGAPKRSIECSYTLVVLHSMPVRMSASQRRVAEHARLAAQRPGKRRDRVHAAPQIGGLFGGGGGDESKEKKEKPAHVGRHARASTRADTDSERGDDDEEEVSAAGTYQCMVKARRTHRRAAARRARAFNTLIRSRPRSAPRAAGG